MSKKLIDLYKDWMETMTLPYIGGGLCNSIPYQYLESLDLISPTDENLDLMGKKRLAITYWGSGLLDGDPERYYKFTPLRQTIVLLICAMHNEI